MIESGQAGFILTVISLVVAVFCFAALAWTDPPPVVRQLSLIALGTAAAGHFLLGGSDFRKQMIADRAAQKEKRSRPDDD